MRFIADLHIHSKYSRACSKVLDLRNLEKYAHLKGVDLLGTGDFTHPKWIEEIKSNLIDDGLGVLRSKTGFPFICQTEISLMYSQAGKGRKVHLVVFAPNLEVVDQITEDLKKIGRVDYDGRPIFGVPCPEFVERMMSISRDIEIIPAHAWTPHFGVFGSMSGFDSMKQCFQEKVKFIHALETGLSSDPEMNWRVSALDKYALLSFSDLHSFWPWRLGREATVFELKKLSYEELVEAVRTKNGLRETIEFWPHEGKYHFDGHRNCDVVMGPKQSVLQKKICPACRKQMTIGVAHRVEELADRPEGFVPKGAVPFKTLIPLSELLAKSFDAGVATKKVWEEYHKLINRFKSEYNILLNSSMSELQEITHAKIAELILMNRQKQITIAPGYDGVYGVPEIEPIDGFGKVRKGEKRTNNEIKQKVQNLTLNKKAQQTLFDY